MILHGPRITIRPMKRADLEEMANWRPFADPLYQPFDFPRRSKTENLQWFTWRQNDSTRQLYTLENQAGEVIGSLTLREIMGRRFSRLGITIGADFVSQGYGTEALTVFLSFYFEEMGFAEIILDVAATNLRAVHCYKALGFAITGEHYRQANHASYHVLRRDPQYAHLRGFFRSQGTLVQVLFYDMALTRVEWLARQKSPGQPTLTSP